MCLLFVSDIKLFTLQNLDEEEDPDSILADVRYMYEDPDHYVDPNDMLTDFDTLRKAKSIGDFRSKLDTAGMQISLTGKNISYQNDQ